MHAWTHPNRAAKTWPHPHRAPRPRGHRRLIRTALVALLGLSATVSAQVWPALSPDRWLTMSVAEVERLIASNDLEATNPNDGFYPGYTALLYALLWGSSNEVVLALVDAGADIDTTSAPTTAALHLATANADPTIARALIARGANLEIEDQWGRTPLLRAMTVGTVRPAVHDLIAAGADVHARSEFGDTLLHIAAEYAEDPDIIHFVVGLGLDVHARNDFDHTALHIAAHNSSNPDVIRALVDLGLDVNVRGDGDRTPLHFTMRNADASVAATLIELDADVTAVNRRGDTPLLSLARLGMAAGAIDALLDVEAPVDVRDSDGLSVRDLLAQNDWLPTGERSRLLQRIDAALADPRYGQRHATAATPDAPSPQPSTPPEQPSPPATAPTLGHGTSARHGALELIVDFLPDPVIIDVSAGGSVWHPVDAQDCVGYLDPSVPTLHLDYVAGSYDLTIGATADADLALTVRTPDGTLLCDDDGRGLDPSLTIAAPVGGRYTIWLSAWGDAGVLHDARLAVSEAGFGPHDEGAIPAADSGAAAPTTSAAPGLELPRTTLAPGDDLQVRFSGGPGNPRDWIGIYRAGAQPGTNYLDWLYVDDAQRPGPGARDGSVTFFGLDLDPGDYAVWFMLADGYEPLGPALRFTVTAASNAATLTVTTPFLTPTPSGRDLAGSDHDPADLERFLNQLEQALLERLNRYHHEHGLVPFRRVAELDAIAIDMASRASAEAAGAPSDTAPFRPIDLARSALPDARVRTAGWLGWTDATGGGAVFDGDPADRGRRIAESIIGAGYGLLEREDVGHAGVGVALDRDPARLRVRVVGAVLEERRFAIAYPLPGVVMRDADASRVPFPVAERSQAEVASFVARAEATLVALMNRFRTERGLPALAAHDTLDQVARAHSADMALRDFYDHEDPDGVRPHQRVVAALPGEDVAASAENIHTIAEPNDVTFALGPDWLAHRLFDDWIHSDGHRGNILHERLTHIGLGIVFTAEGDRVYATQKFARFR